MVLVSPLSFPVLQSVNGALNQDPVNEAPVVKEAPIVEEVKESSVAKEAAIVREAPISKDHQPLNGVENVPPYHVRVSFFL